MARSGRSLAENQGRRPLRNSQVRAPGPRDFSGRGGRLAEDRRSLFLPDCHPRGQCLKKESWGSQDPKSQFCWKGFHKTQGSDKTVTIALHMKKELRRNDCRENA